MHTTSQRHEDRIITTVRISPNEVGVRETPYGVVLDAPGLSVTAQPGAPALPRTRIRIAVPPGTWPDEMKVDEGEWVTIAKGVVVPIDEPQAGQPPNNPSRGRDKGDPHDNDLQPCSQDCDCRTGHPDRSETEGPLVEGLPPPAPARPDPTAYRRAVEEPMPLAVAAAVDPLPGLRTAAVEISPVRQTKDGTVALCTSLTVSLTFTTKPRVAHREETAKRLAEELGRDIDVKRLHVLPDGPKEVTDEDLDLARHLVVNPDIFDDVPVVVLDRDSAYLIITDDRTWDAQTVRPNGERPGLTDAFEELAALKRRRGISARVVTVTDIVEGRYGDFRAGSRDLQETIRRFLKAHRTRWGVRWLLLGGDLETVPARTVAGGCRGMIDTTATNPPEDNRSFWTGGHLRMNVANPGEWWGASADNLLTRPDTGRLIPYDATGSSSATRPGWFFTNSSYTVRQTAPSQYVRVNGPASLLDARLQWLYRWNQLPTDFYYSSLQAWYVGKKTLLEFLGLTFEVPWVYEPDHDWDVRDNGIYGQCTERGRDLDGVHLVTDISVGRVPADTADEARGYVAKLAAYERLDGPVGPLVDRFSSSMLLASSNWGGPQRFTVTGDAVPPAGRFTALADRSLLHVGTVPDSWEFDLVSQVSETDRRVLPRKTSDNPATRGWYYARSDSDTRVAEIDLFFFRLRYRTPWIVVHGTGSDRNPAAFQLDWTGQDGSMADQETLRRQIAAGVPGIRSFRRAYEDEHDLGWFERLVAPVRYLGSGTLREELDRGPALVSLSGHGNGNGCCGGSVRMARALTNSPYAFVGYADSCLTSEFDRDDAFGEALVCNPDGGAVGYVGNSRFSWIGIGDDFQRAFFDRLRTTRHLGWLNDTRVAVAGSHSPNAYWRWPVFTLNLLGDPELQVRRQARRPLVIDIDEDLLHLRVLDDLTPVPWARVTVSSGRAVTELVTDAKGTVTLTEEIAKRLAADGVTISVEHEDYPSTTSELVGAG